MRNLQKKILENFLYIQQKLKNKFKNNIIYRFLEFANELTFSLLRRIIKDKILLLILIILTLFFFFIIKLIFSAYFKKIFFVFLLTALGILSLLPQRIRFMSFIGFELCMMAVVLTSIIYGRKYGLFVSFSSLIGGYILSGNFKPSSFISIFTLPLIALISPFFYSYFDLSLFYLGILMTLIYDVIILPLYILMGSRIYTSIIFFITHIIFNAWVFYFIVPFFFNIMI